MSKDNKAPAKSKAYCVRVGGNTRQWLEGQVDPKDDDAQSVPGVIRRIVKDAKRKAKAPPNKP